MSGLLSLLPSQLRAVAVSAVSASAGNTAASSDALALANDMAARPWDYEIPEWVQSVSRLLDFLRSRNRAALAFKRRCAGAALLVGLAFWAYRRWAADRRRSAKSRALALEAQEAAARGQRFLTPSPSPPSESRREDLSLGDRFMESHPPQNEGALIPVETSERRKSVSGVAGAEDKPSQKHRVAVDALFFARLRKILAIAVPSVWSTEFRYLVILTGLLVARTWFSIIIAELIGQNAQSMVSRRWNRMWSGIKTFALITIPASAVNSGLKYYQEMTALRFRKRLSEHVHEQYLDGTNFYKACNLGGDERIDNADQRVTADIKDFSDEIAALYSSMLKPLLDVVLFTWKLGTLLGWQGPLAMHSYFVLSGYIKKAVMPNLGKLVARESELEGFYRTAHNRLITNSEEIAFYDGSAKEKKIINNALQLICAHISYARYVKALIGIFDGLLVKYYASIAGYCTLLSPFIFHKNTGSSTADLTRDYIRNSQYLGQLSTAVGQLVMVGNKLNSIAGYTSRVSELLEQVAHLNAVGNEPFEIKPEVPHIAEAVQAGSEYSSFVASWKQRCDEQHQLRLEIRAASAHHEQQQPALNNNASAVAASDPHAGDVRHIIGGGTIELGESIEFRHVDIVSPEGKLLVHDLNFEVTSGTNVMVTGPNGVGKSSLFRIIGELWPLHSGVLIKPSKEEILFVPQKPYLVLGTLRDQIIYPHEYEDMKRLGVTDEHLAALLAIVDPARNITTEWGWDTVKDWFHAFSGGQKQRIAMARLFYHRPKFAILDECTSAVSDEVESTIYSTCRLLGITIFTVSHRPQLARFHDRVLRFEGQTRWSVTEIDSKAEMQKADKEKQALAAAAAASVALTSAMSSTALNKMQQNSNRSSSRNVAHAASASSSSSSSSSSAAAAPAAAAVDDSADGDRDATGDADPAATPAAAAPAASSAQQPQHAAGQQQGGGGGKKKRGGRH